MKISTWNVNSVNARIDHIINFLKKTSVDILLLQELKCINENFPSDKIDEIGYKHPRQPVRRTDTPLKELRSLYPYPFCTLTLIYDIIYYDII